MALANAWTKAPLEVKESVEGMDLHTIFYVNFLVIPITQLYPRSSWLTVGEIPLTPFISHGGYGNAPLDYQMIIWVAFEGGELVTNDGHLLRFYQGFDKTQIPF